MITAELGLLKPFSRPFLGRGGSLFLGRAFFILATSNDQHSLSHCFVVHYVGNLSLDLKKIVSSLE